MTSHLPWATACKNSLAMEPAILFTGYQTGIWLCAACQLKHALYCISQMTTQHMVQLTGCLVVIEV